MQMRAILATKGRQVHRVDPGDTVLAAIERMAQRDIGSLMVIDPSGAVVGIVTERDCLRCVAKGPDYRDMPVEQITTRDIAVAELDDDVRHVVESKNFSNSGNLPRSRAGKSALLIRSLRRLPRSSGPAVEIKSCSVCPV